MTRGQLKTRIQQRLDRSDSTFNTLVENWINEVIKTVEDSWPLEYCKRSQETTLVSNQGVYTLPELLILHHPWSFRLESLAQPPIQYDPIIRMHDRTMHVWITSPDDPTGIPNYYIMEGGTNGLNFRLYPVPNETRDLDITGGYYYTDTSLWDDNSQNWLTAKYPNLIIEAVAANAFNHYGEKQSASDAMGLYRMYLNGDEKAGISGLIPNERRRERKGRMIRFKTLDDLPLNVAIKMRRFGF